VKASISIRAGQAELEKKNLSLSANQSHPFWVAVIELYVLIFSLERARAPKSEHSLEKYNFFS
jgi:hypothetical protein